MKFKTEITTRNWNNGWVDIDLRKPKNDTSNYILYRARIIRYDIKTLKSDYVEVIKGMGQADYINDTWSDVHADYGCDRCWNQRSHDFLEEYYYTPLNNCKPLYGKSPDGEEIISDAPYEIVDSDVFETNPNRLYMLHRTHYPTRRGVANENRVGSVDFEILAWCSVPDDPINPFEKENEESNV